MRTIGRFVSIDLGFVFWQDYTCYYYVRAVFSPNLFFLAADTRRLSTYSGQEEKNHHPPID